MARKFTVLTRVVEHLQYTHARSTSRYSLGTTPSLRRMLRRVKLQKVAKEYGELPHALPALASGMRERRKEDEASARVLLEEDLTPVLAQNPQRRRATRQ